MPTLHETFWPPTVDTAERPFDSSKVPTISRDAETPVAGGRNTKVGHYYGQCDEQAE